MLRSNSILREGKDIRAYNYIIEYYRSVKSVSSYEQDQFVRFLVLEMEDDVIEIPLIIKKLGY